jgi:hypothetical protein
MLWEVREGGGGGCRGETGSQTWQMSKASLKWHMVSLFTKFIHGDSFMPSVERFLKNWGFSLNVLKQEKLYKFANMTFTFLHEYLLQNDASITISS